LLALIGFIIPISNSCWERGFSALKYILNEYRTSLNYFYHYLFYIFNYLYSI
jgi:hypothetical protein